MARNWEENGSDDRQMYQSRSKKLDSKEKGEKKRRESDYYVEEEREEKS